MGRFNSPQVNLTAKGGSNKKPRAYLLGAFFVKDSLGLVGEDGWRDWLLRMVGENGWRGWLAGWLERMVDESVAENGC